MDCIFCKIIEGELPCYKVYEDKRALAFLDINPVNKGHVLIVPKEHHRNFLDLPKDLLKDLTSLAQDLAQNIMDGVGATAFNLTANNGKEAGQQVEHFHWHVIPRFANDHLHHWPGKTFSDEEMKRFTMTIRKSI
ncbi:MAG: HIT family protein [Candidatus Komeilibacteria bacterium]|nr:HIT family protein [Candidatus Komeilibacteria bacterium]